MRTLAITLAPGLDLGRRAFRPRLASLIGLIATWRRVARERRQLAAVEPRLLADMGLTAEDVRREAARPFWDVTAR